MKGKQALVIVVTMIIVVGWIFGHRYQFTIRSHDNWHVGDGKA